MAKPFPAFHPVPMGGTDAQRRPPRGGARIGHPMKLIAKALVRLSIRGPWYHAWYRAWYAGKFKSARSAEAQHDGASSAWDSAGVAAVALVVVAITIWATSDRIRRSPCATAVQKTAAPEKREKEERRATEAAPCVPVQAHRSDPEAFKWLVRTLQILPKTRLTASGGVMKVENPLNGHRSETMWNAGLAAWNEHCEALRLQLRSSGAEQGHGVTLEAILDKQIRGCFVSCGWSNAQQLQPDQTADDMFLGYSLWLSPPWSDGSWWSVTSHEIYHAVYHDSPVGRVPRPPAPRPAVHVDEPSDYRLLPLLLPLPQLLLVIQLAATAAALAHSLAAAIFAALALAAATAAAQAFVDIALARTLARATGALTVAVLLTLALAADIFAALALAATAERALA